MSDELVARLGLAPGGRDAARRARRSIVAALALAAETDRPTISYSRSRDWYASGAHYRGCDYSYATVVQAVDELIEAGLVIERRGLVRMGGSGVQSTMRASDLFMERLGGDLSVEHVAPSCLIMRGEDGRMMPLPRTDQIRRMLRGIDDVNAGLRHIRVTVDPKASPDDWRFGERHWKARKLHANGLETWADVLPTPYEYVVQILGRGRTDCHGRLYAWYLGLPKVRRRELLLNGEQTAEPDFEFLHPDLLYAIAGATRDGDPYVTGVHHRDHNKLALNVGINAKGGRTGAIRAIADHDRWRKWGLDYAMAGQVYDEVTKRNPAIAPFLGSDAGVRLMGLDSRMCIKVLAGCRKQGIAALPVHDSFIVPEKNKGQVQAIMQEVLHATRVEISPGSSNTCVKSILQALPAVPASPPGAASSPLPSSSGSTLRRVKSAVAKAVPCPSQPVEEVASPVVPLTRRTPSWDRQARERAMVVYQRRVAVCSAQEDGVRRGSYEWHERMDLAVSNARFVSDMEWDTRMRAFDVRCVPDRLPGEAKPKAPRKPMRGRAKHRSSFRTGQGRRHSEDLPAGTGA